MATLLSALETQVRRHLIESTASFWSSDELIDIMNKGIKDMWGAIVDLHEEHFLTVDTTNVTYTADGTSLSNIPTDVFRVYLIEPVNTTSTGNYNRLVFAPKDYNDPAFIAARTESSIDPTQEQIVYYHVTSAGAPVGAPTILIAPPLSASLAAGSIRFVYIPVLAAVAAAGNNPIPGESDEALIAFTVAHARAKERDDRSPDPNWIEAYKTEKAAVVNRLTPRQVQDVQYVEALWQSLW